MNFLKKMFKGTGNDIVSKEELISMNVCPNCWGKTEYQKQFKESIKTLHHNQSDPKTFIQQFVETNITGIRLKKDGLKRLCPNCNTSFK